MTNEQIVEALAKVMGWKRSSGEPFNCMVDVWIDDKGVYQYATELSMDNGGEILEPFKPLNNHNDMALVRKKMRDDGWKFNRDDLFDRNDTLFDEPYEATLCYNGHYVCCETAKDELMAEALVILAAVRKGGGE